MDEVENATGYNGKTFLIGLLEYAFPELLEQADPRILEENYSNKCLKQIIRKSLIYADGGTKNKVIPSRSKIFRMV
jgi:hypothetical protein